MTIALAADGPLDAAATLARYHLWGEENITEVIIGKQRNGPIGTVKVVFLPQYARFENVADFHRQTAGPF